MENQTKESRQGIRYEGPIFTELPRPFRERMWYAAVYLSQESKLGMRVQHRNKVFKDAKPEELWNVGEYTELYVYDRGFLLYLFFRKEQDVFKVFFSGEYKHHRVGVVENALGLDVQYPQDKTEPVLQCAGRPLERIVLGRSEKPMSLHMIMPPPMSGPYFVR